MGNPANSPPRPQATQRPTSPTACRPLAHAARTTQPRPPGAHTLQPKMALRHTQPKPPAPAPPRANTPRGKTAAGHPMTARQTVPTPKKVLRPVRNARGAFVQAKMSNVIQRDLDGDGLLELNWLKQQPEGPSQVLLGRAKALFNKNPSPQERKEIGLLVARFSTPKTKGPKPKPNESAPPVITITFTSTASPFVMLGKRAMCSPKINWQNVISNVWRLGNDEVHGEPYYADFFAEAFLLISRLSPDPRRLRAREVAAAQPQGLAAADCHRSEPFRHGPRPERFDPRRPENDRDEQDGFAVRHGEQRAFAVHYVVHDADSDSPPRACHSKRAARSKLAPQHAGREPLDYHGGAARALPVSNRPEGRGHRDDYGGARQHRDRQGREDGLRGRPREPRDCKDTRLVSAQRYFCRRRPLPRRSL